MDDTLSRSRVGIEVHFCPSRLVGRVRDPASVGRDARGRLIRGRRGIRPRRRSVHWLDENVAPVVRGLLGDEQRAAVAQPVARELCSSACREHARLAAAHLPHQQVLSTRCARRVGDRAPSALHCGSLLSFSSSVRRHVVPASTSVTQSRSCSDLCRTRHTPPWRPLGEKRGVHGRLAAIVRCVRPARSTTASDMFSVVAGANAAAGDRRRAHCAGRGAGPALQE